MTVSRKYITLHSLRWPVSICEHNPIPSTNRCSIADMNFKSVASLPTGGFPRQEMVSSKESYVMPKSSHMQFSSMYLLLCYSVQNVRGYITRQSALSFACGMPISSKVAGPFDGFGLAAGAVAAELAVLVLVVGDGNPGRS